MFSKRVVENVADFAASVEDEWKMMFLVYIKKKRMCRNIYCIIPEARTYTLLVRISRIDNSQHAGSFIARGDLHVIAYASSGGVFPPS